MGLKPSFAGLGASLLGRWRVEGGGSRKKWRWDEIPEKYYGEIKGRDDDEGGGEVWGHGERRQKSLSLNGAKSFIWTLIRAIYFFERFKLRVAETLKAGIWSRVSARIKEQEQLLLGASKSTSTRSGAGEQKVLLQIPGWKGKIFIKILCLNFL